MKSFHKTLGREGERLAEQYLKKKGFTFVCRNFVCHGAEVDLIFLDGDDPVFVEVKTMTEKSEEFFGTPALKVDRKKQQRLTRAAADFLARHPHLSYESYPRFDIVEVTLKKQGPSFSHIPNAFLADSGFYKKKLF